MVAMATDKEAGETMRGRWTRLALVGHEVSRVIAPIQCDGSIKIKGEMSLMMAFQNWFERA
jgi:hypothetical protein